MYEFYNLTLQAAEGARVSGASRIIGVDLNPARFEQGGAENLF